EKEVEISLSGKLLDQAFTFEGEYAMKMSDFGITPPSAMFGQIQTDDDVLVKFSLVLQPSP
ncbi:MAG: YceI family protein, partial [Bacteroidota bacterium]